MLNATIRVDESTDVEKTLKDVKARCSRAGISEMSEAALMSQIMTVLQPLVEQGRVLAAQGSKMKVVRDFSGPDYRVILDLDIGGKKSAFRRLFDVFSGG